MPSDRIWKWTLLRPATLLALAAIGPLTIYAGFNGYIAVNRRVAAMAEQSVANARFVAENVDRQVDGALEDAETLAEAPALDASGGLGSFETVAMRTRTRHSDWIAVVLVTPDGRWVYSTESGEAKGRRVEDKASLDKAVATRRPVVGDIVKGKGGRWGIPLRAPVIRDGKVVYVVTVVLNPEAVRQTLAGLHLPSPWIANIVNSQDHVVARLPDAAGVIGIRVNEAAIAHRTLGGGGSYHGLTVDHVPTQTFYWVSPVSHWSAHIAMPRAVYEAPLRQMLLTMSGGFLVCLGLAGALLLLWIREYEGRRRQGAAVEQATRVDALGRLTGGVAHDFNNLLTVIQGNTEILSRRLQGNTQAERPLAAIRQATERAAKLTRQLLVFARGGPAEPVVVDLARRVIDLLGSISQLVGAGVTVETDFEPGLPPVLVDPLQLEAALLNLAANARDAMEGKGQIEIRAWRRGNEVSIAVRDHGPGFDPQVLSRVFDRFFTTKPVGKGTGLGLSQVYGLVKNAGGEVEAANAPGGGAIVTLSFPAHTGAGAALPEPFAPIPHQGGGSSLASILLVDDNDAVRATTAAYLRECGLSVIEAPDASHALQSLERAKVEAVVSDIIMPGDMDGMTLAEEIKARWPSMPVLLVSGFSERASEAQARGFPVVNKPYSLPELEKRLQRLVEPSAAEA